ncbi:cyclase family protein [Dactylosporangium sp. CA-092794]|uniref:cyclase family protein n=1 Tax=Dactylosporangium sp. CA-092794 TaxID=3239929 RepID=UPI003D93687F
MIDHPTPGGAQPTMQAPSPRTSPALAGERSDRLLAALGAGVRVFDLGHPLFVGMPQSPNHPAFTHHVVRRHGDMVRADGGSAAGDLLLTGTHVGTHIDALAHVSHDGRLHGGVAVAEAMRSGRFATHGAETIQPMFRRGVLLDIPGALGLPRCDPGYEITPDDLRAAAAAQRTRLLPGDVVLIRSGWAQLFEHPEAFVGAADGVPGVGAAGARWLAAQRVHAAGADTIAFERLAPGAGHSLLPAHRILLVEHGIYLIEAMVLEELAARGVHEFTFVLAPLPIVGATGSPARPLAVTARD